MNERIRELMIQSMIDTGRYQDVQKTYEKFAELIVLECADICEAYGMPDGTSPVSELLSKVIKRKFGVE